MTIALIIWGILNTAGFGLIAWHACKRAREIKQQITAEALSIRAAVRGSEQAVLDAFVPHADKLHATVEDLRTSARTMHDEAQARVIAPRVVPGRG